MASAQRRDSDSSGSGHSEDDFKFVRKALHLDDCINDRAEFSCIDYTPLTNIKPVDLTAVLRPRKLCVESSRARAKNIQLENPNLVACTNAEAAKFDCLSVSRATMKRVQV